MQRLGQGAEATNWLRETGQVEAGYLSAGLAELAAYYSNRLSYQEVEGLVERLTGERQVSDQKIQQVVTGKAAQVSAQWSEELVRTAESGGGELPTIASRVALYEAEAAEVLVLSDAIQVKRQKAERGVAAVGPKRVSTEVWEVERRDGSFVTLVGGLAGTAEVCERVRAEVAREYARPAEERAEELPIVVVSDGAQSIRCDLVTIFGVLVTIILDWYHLEKKVWELLSMACRNKSEKEWHARKALSYLWRGGVSEALRYLREEVEVKNAKKLEELTGYLEKHREEIIDYERRKARGKAIGSGRMEKGVDQVIGRRQKHKGMSWSQKGSQALGILKTCEMNGEWEKLWQQRRAA